MVNTYINMECKRGDENCNAAYEGYHKTGNKQSVLQANAVAPVQGFQFHSVNWKKENHVKIDETITRTQLTVSSAFLACRCYDERKRFYECKII